MTYIYVKNDVCIHPKGVKKAIYVNVVYKRHKGSETKNHWESLNGFSETALIVKVSIATEQFTDFDLNVLYLELHSKFNLFLKKIFLTCPEYLFMEVRKLLWFLRSESSSSFILWKKSSFFWCNLVISFTA